MNIKNVELCTKKEFTQSCREPTIVSETLLVDVDCGMGIIVTVKIYDIQFLKDIVFASVAKKLAMLNNKDAQCCPK